MAAANRKRVPFDAEGPFVARKNFLCSGENFHRDEVCTADQLGVGERRLEQLYSANYIDMAPPKAKVTHSTAHPLDRDGDGHKGGSLSDAEEAALAADGLTVEAWLALPEAEREEALANALRAAQAPAGGQDSETGASGATDEENPSSGPENGSESGTTAGAAGDAPPVAEAGEAGAATGAATTSPADTKVAAYKSFGFGKYHPINAAGEKLDDKAVGKAAAQGLAAAAGVPLLGQNQTLGG